MNFIGKYPKCRDLPFFGRKLLFGKGLFGGSKNIRNHYLYFILQQIKIKVTQEINKHNNN